jgi:hypothetical protein
VHPASEFLFRYVIVDVRLHIEGKVLRHLAFLGHLSELPHHPLHILELGQQPIDILAIDAAAASDAPAPTVFDPGQDCGAPMVSCRE